MPVKTSVIPRGRPRLAAVLQHADSFIVVDDVVTALSLDRREAAKTLAQWQKQGWIKRLKRGVYTAIPLTAQATEQVLEDPWILIPEIFGEAYVAGWSAAEHWGLTEQLFRSICVFTTKPVKHTEINIQGIPFVLKHIPKSKLFGFKPVWRGSIKVLVSTPARTIIDMLDDPRVGGGIVHIAECLNTFFSSNLGRWEDLLNIAEKLRNGAVFKRLGFIIERALPQYSQLVEKCKEQLTSGLAKLDPALSCPHVVKRWNLRVP